MIPFYNRAKEEIKHLRKMLFKTDIKTDDIYALNILQPILVNYPYLPFNGGALRPFCLSYILNEIIIGQRRNIIEFGCGISTIVIARLIKQHNIKTHLTSIEHDVEWMKIVNKQLLDEGLEQYVTLINIGLTDCSTDFGVIASYDFKNLFVLLEDQKFDLIIVDGPPAYKTENALSRLPIFLNISEFFDSDVCFILDDANRKGEQQAIKYYKSKRPDLYFSLEGTTLGVFRSRKLFNPTPIFY